MTEDRVYMTILFDHYGALLTERQQKLMALRYNDDLSLSEIAEVSGGTRQSVWDTLRRADAIAREDIINIIVTIISEESICVTYVTNEDRSPTCIPPTSPASFITIRPPIQRTATVVRFMHMVMTGCIPIIILYAAVPARRSAPFARRNFSSSCASRTKLFTTRTFVTLSSTVEFSASIRS